MYRNHNGKAAFKDYKSYVQREIRRFEFNYWNQTCDEIIAKANAGDSRGYYAARKNMYGDQPNKANSHKAFKKADGQLTQSPEETLAVMELHTRILLNHPGSANLSDVNRYLPPQAEILHDLAKPFVLEELLSAMTGMKAEKACGSDAIPIEFWNWAASENLYVEVLRLFNKSLQY